MKFLEEIDRLQRLHRLIRLKATGTPSQLASRLQVSERTVYNEVETLRALGAPIKYCKVRQSYFYAYDIELMLGIVKPQRSVQ
jgi:predicted DNA-binding transcriptional regulator YafY